MLLVLSLLAFAVGHNDGPLELLEFFDHFPGFVVVFAEFFEGDIDISHNFSIDKQVKRNVLEVDSLIVPFDHVLQDHADEPVEAVLDLGQVFFVLVGALLCFLQLLFAGLLVAGGFLETVFEGDLLVDDKAIGFFEGEELAFVVEGLFLFGFEGLLYGEEVVLSFGELVFEVMEVLVDFFISSGDFVDFFDVFGGLFAVGIFKGLLFVFELIYHELDVVLEGLNFISPLEGVIIFEGNFFVHEGFGKVGFLLLEFGDLLLELGEVEFERFGLGVEVDFVLADLDDVAVFVEELLLHIL